MSEEVVATPVEEQVEIAAPEESGEIAPESATGENEPTPEETPKPKGGFQKRIDKLTRKTSELEQEKEYWRQQALRTASETAKEAPKAESKPKADDFENVADYVEALTEYKVKQAAKESEGKSKLAQEQRQREEATRNYNAKEAAFREATPDFDDVIADVMDTVTTSPALLEEVVTHEHGPALAYYLGQNPDVAERLSELSPVQVAREVARLESKFVQSAPAEKGLTVSKAPKPPTPVTKSSKTSEKEPGEMDAREYMAWRAKNFPGLNY